MVKAISGTPNDFSIENFGERLQAMLTLEAEAGSVAASAQTLFVLIMNEFRMDSPIGAAVRALLDSFFNDADPLVRSIPTLQRQMVRMMISTLRGS